MTEAEKKSARVGLRARSEIRERRTAARVGRDGRHAPAILDEIAYEPPCPACSSPTTRFLGTLGGRDCFRCRECGWDFSSSVLDR